MKLGTRIAITLALTVIPFAIGLSAFQVLSERAQVGEAATQFVLGRMNERAGERCEESPALFPNDRQRPRAARGRQRRARRRAVRRQRGGPAAVTLVPYAADFESGRDGAPPVHATLREALDDGEPSATRFYRAGNKFFAETLVRMPWQEGPCAMVLLRRPTPPGPFGLGGFVRSVVPSLLITLAAVLMTLLAAGPLARRIRRLTTAVKEKPGDPLLELVGGHDEIAQLAGAFDEARHQIDQQLDALTRRDQALTDYITNTTHDVMVPLTVLSGHLSKLDKAVHEGEAADAGRIQSSLREAHYIASLLHNLNAAARLKSGEAELVTHPSKLGDLVERVIERHRPIARSASIALDYSIPDVPLTIDCDVTLLEQAVSNLVHNALRYNKAGGHIAVVLEERSGTFTLEVLDDGPGIAEAELSKVRSRSYRSDTARTRHPYGMGIGLAIVEDVTSRHGYTFTLDNRPEGGLVARLTGPVSA